MPGATNGDGKGVVVGEVSTRSRASSASASGSKEREAAFRGGQFSINSPHLHLENLPVNAPALVFVSPGTTAPVEVGGGLFCLGSGAIRQPIVSARLDGMALLEVDVFAFPLSMQGQTVYAQAIYRDAGTACGLNASSGTSFLLQ